MKKLFKYFLLLPFLLTSCGKTKGEYTFICAEHSFTTYYEDKYFTLDNRYYHEEIALASYASAMASNTTDGDYSEKSNHLTRLWKRQGFTNIFVNNSFKEKPTLDSIGVGFASKKIDDFNLIAITIRSGEYGAEWGSNLTVGPAGHSAGFKNSSDIVLNELANYLVNNNFTGHTKFWLSGYSRGGSVINLAAATMLDQIEADSFYPAISTSVHDIYAYCFEPPSCAGVEKEEASKDIYKCIHNIMNYNDIIPLVPPFDWGLIRYGQSYFYPDRILDINFNATERRKLVSNYHFTNGAQDFPDYTIDDWNFYDPGPEAAEEKNLPRESIFPSQGRFAHGLVHQLFGTGLSRDQYYVGVEKVIRDIVATFFGYNPDVKEVELGSDVFIDLLFSYSLVQNIVSDLFMEDFYGFTKDIQLFLYLLFDVDENNIEIINELFSSVQAFLLFIGIFLNYRPDYMLQLFSRNNMLGLIFPHSCELNYSFLKSCDRRIYGNDACKLNDGTYQILHIKTPSSVTIYENTLKKNVFSYTDGKMSSDTLSAEKMHDGSIDIYLPKNGDYIYKIESEDISLSNVDEYGTEEIVYQTMSKEGHIARNTEMI